MDSEIIKETECIVISYTNSLINKYKENKIMRDDYVHVLLFFLEIVDIPIIGKLQSKIKEVIIGILEEIKRDLYEKKYSYLYYAGMENGIGRLAFSLEIFSEKIHNIPNFESYIGELLEIGVGESIDNANLEEVQAYNYDLIYGIAGVLYYSLNTHKIKEKTIYNMINFLVELYRIKSHDWGSIIRYHIEKDKLLLADEKVKYPKGCINFGLAHGIIAPLIALAKAKKYGYNVKGINATISGLRQLYEKYSVRDMNILKYPTMLSVEDYFSNTVSKDSITYNAGWCYGNAGIVRGLMKVSYYLNDNNNYQYYKKELLSIINQELDNYNFDLPIVCHGYASVLSIQISAFRESGDKSFLITRERNMRQTIISHRNCIFNDEYTNDYSILSGESGTILTLINGIYLSKEYPKLLMID